MAGIGVLEHGDGEKEVAMAELFVGKAGLLGAEEEGYASLITDAREDLGSGGLEGEERMIQIALAYRGSADDKSTVGNGFGDGGIGCRGAKDDRGVDGGARAFKRHQVFVDDTEAGKAEVMHRAGDRADVIWIASAYEDDGDPAEIRFGEHETLF